jgi:hypothetical protein
MLRVPLVLPLTLLEFVASFIPLIGSPIAMAVATVVALASRGVTTAVIVLVLIVVIGQIEGHVLQPFVMGWSVRLHPVAVAVSRDRRDDLGRAARRGRRGAARLDRLGRRQRTENRGRRTAR